MTELVLHILQQGLYVRRVKLRTTKAVFSIARNNRNESLYLYSSSNSQMKKMKIKKNLTNLTDADLGASYNKANSPSMEPLPISRFSSPLIVTSRTPESTMYNLDPGSPYIKTKRNNK